MPHTGATVFFSRLVGLLLIFTLAISGSAVRAADNVLAPYVPAPASETDPVTIWHIPHPDDETLGMAGAITASVEAGRRNIVVFYTQGGASGILWVLNGGVYSRLHNRYLQPEAEGYTPLTVADFKQARVREARAALAVLGVHPDDIIVLDFPDGDLRLTDALPVMRSLARKYPDAAHRTTALEDSHPDHQTLAKALITLTKERLALGLTTDAKMFAVYRYGTDPARRGEGAAPVAVPDMNQKQRALAEFAHWEPAAGRFAIGQHSVPGLFAAAHTDPYEYEQPLDANVPFTRLSDRRHGVTFFPDHAIVDYPLARHWSLRLATPYNFTHMEPAVVRKTPRVANIIALFGGVGYRPGHGPSPYWLLGLEWFDAIVTEYRHGPTGKFHVGYRVGF